MRFEFATSTRIIFGQGSVREIIPAAKSLGGRGLVIAGEQPPPGVSMWIEQLKNERIAIGEFQVSGEPTDRSIISGLEQARREKCEWIVAIGGGSVIDTGKAVAGLMSNPGELNDYLEVVGQGKPLVNPSAPCIAVPTTAGTGSEVTRNAVLAVTQARIKVSLRSPYLLPRLAVIDPELTYSLPPAITAASGLDALTQLIEPYLSNASNPITDALCREGVGRVARSIARACEQADDRVAREDMSLASLFGGMALANARLGFVHGLAGPIGGMFPAPHGAVCARLLPLVLDQNLKAMRDRAAQDPVLARFDEIGGWLTGDPKAGAEDGIQWLQELCSALKIPPLRSYGVKDSDLSEIVRRAKDASSTKGNPIALTDSEMLSVMERAL